MTSEESIETILKDMEQIKRETHENNIMLKELIKYFNYQSLYANQRDMEDFGRNVMANLLSSMMLFK